MAMPAAAASPYSPSTESRRWWCFPHCYRFSDDQRRRVLDSRWWELDLGAAREIVRRLEAEFAGREA